jgi:hypothetical protein
MTADEERRIRELPSLIEKEENNDVVERLTTELYVLLTRSVEAKKLQSTEAKKTALRESGAPS